MLDAPRELLARALAPLYPLEPPLKPLEREPPAGWVLALGTRLLARPAWPVPAVGLVLALGLRPLTPPAWLPNLFAVVLFG